MPHPLRAPGRPAAAGLVILATLFIAIMTLRPVPATDTFPAGCIFCGPLGGVDFALNLLLFVPLGVGLRWLFSSWKASIVVGVITTLIVETLQWRFIAGRDAALGDLLANTTGAALGAWLAVAAIRWMIASPSSARHLAAVFAFLAMVVVTGSAWLLRPVGTRYAQWSQWKPPRPNLDLFQGQLFSVAVNGTPIRPTEVLQPNRTIDAATSSLTVTAAVSGNIPPTRRQAIIVRIANELEEGFVLSQSRAALMFTSNIAATRLRLRPLRSRLDGAFSLPMDGTDGEGTAFTITAQSNPRAMVVTVSNQLHSVTATLHRTVGLAWAMLLPRNIALNNYWWPANAAWLGALLMPVGLFTMRSRRRASADNELGMIWWPLVSTLAALVVVPALAGLSSLGIGEWLGVLFGLAAGATAEQWSYRRSPDRLTQLAD